jgi:hypothetical protein
MLCKSGSVSEGIDPVSMDGERMYVRLALAATAAGLPPVTLIDKKRRAKGEHVATKGRPRHIALD